MKIISIFVNEDYEDWISFLFLSPVPSLRTWKRGTYCDSHQFWQMISLFIPELIILITFYQLPNTIPDLSGAHWSFNSYLAIPVFFLLLNVLNRGCGILYGLAGIQIPDLHENFHRATRLSEFWNHWNIWFSDWLKETLFRPLIRKPTLALLVTFTGSGILHEIVVNFPLWWTRNVNYFGSMVLYFLIQALGILIERNCFRDQKLLNRIWTWSVVVIPAPLILNPGTLLIFRFNFFGSI